VTRAAVTVAALALCPAAAAIVEVVPEAVPSAAAPAPAPPGACTIPSCTAAGAVAACTNATGATTTCAAFAALPRVCPDAPVACVAIPRPTCAGGEAAGACVAYEDEALVCITVFYVTPGARGATSPPSPAVTLLRPQGGAAGGP